MDYSMDYLPTWFRWKMDTFLRGNGLVKSFLQGSIWDLNFNSYASFSQRKCRFLPPKAMLTSVPISWVNYKLGAFTSCSQASWKTWWRLTIKSDSSKVAPESEDKTLYSLPPPTHILCRMPHLFRLLPCSWRFFCHAFCSSCAISPG